jgi:hypothetical protein
VWTAQIRLKRFKNFARAKNKIRAPGRRDASKLMADFHKYEKEPGKRLIVATKMVALLLKR